jgi:hypothetical protein
VNLNANRYKAAERKGRRASHSLQGHPKEDPSLAEAVDPDMAENLGVPEVQLGLATVAPADPGRVETEDQPAAAGD